MTTKFANETIDTVLSQLVQKGFPKVSLEGIWSYDELPEGYSWSTAECTCCPCNSVAIYGAECQLTIGFYPGSREIVGAGISVMGEGNHFLFEKWKDLHHALNTLDESDTLVMQEVFK